MPKLKNKRYEAFCLEYHKNNFNALQAYKKVYKSTDITARKNGSKLLTRTDVQARLKELQEKASKKYGLSVQDLVDRLNFLYQEGLQETPITSSGQVVGHKRQDMNVSIKSIDGLAKIIGAYAPVKTDNKTEVSGSLDVAQAEKKLEDRMKELDED